MQPCESGCTLGGFHYGPCEVGTMSEPEPDYQLGQIVITYALEADAPIITVTLPELEDIPMVTQLGMLEYARFTCFSLMGGPDE